MNASLAERQEAFLRAILDEGRAFAAGVEQSPERGISRVPGQLPIRADGRAR